MADIQNSAESPLQVHGIYPISSMSGLIYKTKITGYVCNSGFCPNWSILATTTLHFHGVSQHVKFTVALHFVATPPYDTDKVRGYNYKFYSLLAMHLVAITDCQGFQQCCMTNVPIYNEDLLRLRLI